MTAAKLLWTMKRCRSGWCLLFVSWQWLDNQSRTSYDRPHYNRFCFHFQTRITLLFPSRSGHHDYFG
jgi:hypothetical protein